MITINIWLLILAIAFAGALGFFICAAISASMAMHPNLSRKHDDADSKPLPPL